MSPPSPGGWLPPAVLAVLGVAELVALEVPGRAVAGVLLVGACTLLALRASHPLLAGTGAGLLVLAVPWAGPELDQVAAVALVLVLGCYALGRWPADLRGLVGIAVLLVAAAVTYAAVDERAHDASDLVLWVALVFPAFVVGRLARRLADHNELLQREQVLLRRRAVRDERDRISRELNDLVAHSVTAMVLQVEAAADVLQTDPDRAEEMLDRAADTGRLTLAETGRLLHSLRDTENELGLLAAPLPAPGELVGGLS